MSLATLDRPLEGKEKEIYTRFARSKSPQFATQFILDWRQENARQSSSKRRIKEELAAARCRSTWRDVLQWLVDWKKPQLTPADLCKTLGASNLRSINRYLNRLCEWGALEREEGAYTTINTVFQFPLGDPPPPTPREEFERLLLRAKGRGSTRSRIVRWVLLQEGYWPHSQLALALPEIEDKLITHYLSKWAKAGLLSRKVKEFEPYYRVGK